MTKTGDVMARAWAIAVAVIAVGSIAVSGHEVPVEQLVEMTVQPQGDRLVVRLHVPVTALAEAKLPVLADGTLDTARLDAPLQVAAAETARNLDVQQDDALLAPLAVTARHGADRKSVDIDVAYRVDSLSGGFSARLNAFSSPPLRPVRTIVRYLSPAKPAQVVSVTGAPVRVRFDPGTIETIRLFVARGLTSTLASGDHLLWLVCVLLPLRTAKEAARVIGLMIGGQALSITAVALDPAATALVPIAALIAASAVVVGCLQNVAAARLPLVMGLSLLFGVSNGAAFGDTFMAERQFAGSHQAIGFMTFALVVAAGQVWLAAIMWATRAWLAFLAMPERIATVLVSALLAHTAIHRALDRGHALADDGSFVSARTLTWLALGWASTMLLIALGEFLRRRRVGKVIDALPEDGRA